MATESLDSVRSFFPIHSADTTLLADHFARLLRNHPDQSCVAYVLHALRHGFALVSAGKHDISVFSNNLPSAFTHLGIYFRAINCFLRLQQDHRPHFRHLHFSSCAALELVPSPKRTASCE